MDTTTRTGTPLRQRMIEDMRMRTLEPKIQDGYIRAVRKLSGYFRRSPDTATMQTMRHAIVSGCDRTRRLLRPQPSDGGAVTLCGFA